jgi:hypothetical protein
VTRSVIAGDARRLPPHPESFSALKGGEGLNPSAAEL